MYRWTDGRKPKKFTLLYWAISGILYYLSAAVIIYRTAQNNYTAASLPPVYEADVWPAAVIGGTCAVVGVVDEVPEIRH